MEKQMFKTMGMVAALMLASGFACAEEPEQKVPNLVFVGKLVSIEELPDPCEGKSDCISMDSLWKARYEIEQPIVGSYPQREITISLADHYGFPHPARFEHALLFVGMYSDGPWLHKYQGFPVHPLANGGWGYCGGFTPREGEPKPPKPKLLDFAGELRIRNEWAGGQLSSLLDQDTYSLSRGRVQCKRGLTLPELYDVVRNRALRARGVILPSWTDVATSK